jgi:hypothetical protein
VTINGCIGNPEIRALITPPKGRNQWKLMAVIPNSVYFFDTDNIVQLVDDSIQYGSDNTSI